MRVSYFSITSVECSLTRCTMCVPKPSRRPACRRCIICTFSKGRHANVCNGTKKKHYTVLKATKLVCFRMISRCDLLQEKCHSLPSSVTQTSLSGSGVYPPASTMSSVTVPLLLVACRTSRVCPNRAYHGAREPGSIASKFWRWKSPVSSLLCIQVCPSTELQTSPRLF